MTSSFANTSLNSASESPEIELQTSIGSVWVSVEGNFLHFLTESSDYPRFSNNLWNHKLGVAQGPKSLSDLLVICEDILHDVFPEVDIYA